MGITRRQLLARAAACAIPAAAQQRQANGPKLRTTPAICLFSEQLPKVGYDELGGVLRALGFDGCDLGVQPAGHVTPANASLALMRAVEAMTGVGIDVLVLSTPFTSPLDATVRQMLSWGGEMGVPIFRPGHWKYTGDDIEVRLLEAQRDIAGLAGMARSVGMSLAIHNATADLVGGSVWDVQMIIRGMDARVVGYDFDIGYAAAQGGHAGWSTALRLVLPRLKMVTARDCSWSKDASGAWQLTQCPLGEGMVDWSQFFAMLAHAGFAGPISLQLDYEAKDELAAIRHDLEFLKKQREAAYGAAG